MSSDKAEGVENNYGVNLRRLRKLRGETLHVFAERLGVSGDNISKIETGKGNPSKLLLEKIEKIYGLSRFLTTGDIIEVCDCYNNTIAGNDAIVGRDDHRPTVVNGTGHNINLTHNIVKEPMEMVYSAPDQRGFIKAVVEELWDLPKNQQREILRMILNRGTGEE